MGFDFGRIRRGELIATERGILLLAVLFLLPWFEVRPAAGALAASRDAAVSLNGWHALTTTRWILLVTISVSVALGVVTPARRAPAVPLTLGMLTCALGALSWLVLLYRIFDHAGISTRAGAYLGSVAAVVIAYGGYLSLRIERGNLDSARSRRCPWVVPRWARRRAGSSTSAEQPGP